MVTPADLPEDNGHRPPVMPLAAERIGVIFVHGIGEQRRFEHLDAEIRPLLDALQRRGASVTVEIVGGTASTLRAEQDTWNAQPGPPVRAIVRDGSDQEKHLYFHEVWWADVNEAYSLKKQVLFWFWSLSVWLYPNVTRPLPGRAVMQDPRFPGRGGAWRGLTVRVKLFFVSTTFLLAAGSIGALVFLLKRLLDLGAPDIVRVFVNYLSAIKLYNQPRADRGGFLDAFNEPPRVSVRRRMVRTLADVASQGYDRWYVFAHSLGSVVAHNGLMENAQALANYLDESRWESLKQSGLAGTAGPNSGYFIGDTARMLAARPLWLGPRDVVFRDKLLEKFRGLLTYGSPLDKFAAIWPRRVPINVKEPVFPAGAEWVNVYDPTDPVAGRLEAFSNTTQGNLSSGVLTPRNFGYRASPLLLYSHIKYLGSALADSAVAWILSGNPFQPAGTKRWLRSEWRRRLWTRAMWVAGFGILAVLAAATLSLAISHLTHRSELIAFAQRPLVERTFWVIRSAMTITLVVGIVGAFCLSRIERQARPEEDYWASRIVRQISRMAAQITAKIMTMVSQLFRRS